MYTLQPGCKINIYLLIGKPRPDGMHDLQTIFQHLPSPSDEITIKELPKGAGLLFSSSRADLENQDNSIVRAWRIFGERTDFFPDIEVKLQKQVPVGAGLGGGSADGAAMLLWLNSMIKESKYFQSLSIHELEILSLKLGADTPFFLHGGTALASGVGERLDFISSCLKGFHILVACPTDINISTAWAYRELDKSRNEKSKKALTNPALASIKENFDTSFCLSNDFENIVFKVYPRLRLLKENLLRAGAAGALLSGTGSSVFGIFADPETAAKARQALADQNVEIFVNHLP